MALASVLLKVQQAGYLPYFAQMNPRTIDAAISKRRNHALTLNRLIQSVNDTLPPPRGIEALRALKVYFCSTIYRKKRAFSVQNGHLVKTGHTVFGENAIIRLFGRKGKAVKNWRSRALMIDPKKTNIIIVNGEIETGESEDAQ